MFMIFVKEKLHAGGSLKPTASLQPEDKEPAAASFFITCPQLAGTSAPCFLRSGNGLQERLSTRGGLAGIASAFKLAWPGEEEPCFYLGASALSVDNGIIGKRREEERDPPPLWGRMTKEGGKG